MRNNKVYLRKTYLKFYLVIIELKIVKTISLFYKKKFPNNFAGIAKTTKHRNMTYFLFCTIFEMPIEKAELKNVIIQGVVQELFYVKYNIFWTGQSIRQKSICSRSIKGFPKIDKHLLLGAVHK